MKKKIILFLLLCISLNSIFAENYGKNQRFCDELSATLQANNIIYSIQPLSYAENTLFPYSIIISKPLPDYAKNRENAATLAIIIPQKNAILFKDKLVEFLYELEFIEASCNIEVVLTANDYTTIPKKYSTDYLAGTNTYLANKESLSNLFVIAVSDEKMKEDFDFENAVTDFSFAAKGNVSPSEFVKACMHTLNRCSIPYKCFQSSVGFERLGAVNKDPLLENLLDSNIPCVHFTPSSSIFNFLLNFTEDFDMSKITEWDSQYFMISKTPLIISQKVFVVIMIVDIIIALFLLCFSFFLGNFTYERKVDLKEAFYLIFVILLLYLASLYLAQFLTKLFVPKWTQIPIFSFCVKIILTMCFYELLKQLRFFIKLPQFDYVYGFLLTFSSFANILLFSICDLSFLVYFTPFFIFAALSRINTTPLYKAIFLWLMMICFLPMFLTAGDSIIDVMMYFTDADFINNLFIALFFTPFTLISIQLNLGAGNFRNFDLKNKSEYKYLFKNLIIIGSITAAFIILIPSANAFFKKYLPPKIEVQVVDAECNDENTAQLSFRQNFTFVQYGKEDIDIEITRKEDTIRYSLTLVTSSLMPIYSSSYPFDSFSEQNNIIFNFEENPPEKIMLKLSVDPYQDYTLILTTLTQKDEFTIEKTEKEYFIKGTAGNGRTI